MNITNCPICGQDNVPSQAIANKHTCSYECPVCGEYKITAQAKNALGSKSKEDKAKISAYTRERHIHQMRMITILTETPNLQSLEGPVVGIDDIINTGFPYNVSERLDRILKNLYLLSPHPGAGIPIEGEKYYPVFFAQNEEAYMFFRSALQDKGLIEFGGSTVSPTIVLTPDGWNRIAELEREKGRKDSRQAFVAMWFDSSLDNAWRDGFEKACNDAGYKALRMDLKEHNEKICDAIIAEIRKSRFMIADFTDHRGGVYFEAGFAKGLGIEVIWTCREDEIDKSHFDTRQYNHIVWKNEKDLYEKLRRRIEATIAAG